MGRPADNNPQSERLQHMSTTQQDRPSFDKHNAADIREIQGNANYYETITAAPLDPWSKTSIQLYLILLVAALNATASGIFMIYTIGNMIGSLFTGPICDRFGRRAGMITGSVLIMVGAAVQTAAQSDAYLLGGRFVLGFGVSIGTSSAPTYALELAPPQWRARIVGYYNTCKSCPPPAAPRHPSSTT
ncbi:hypothetical protein MY4824_007454, partial [Beauveria thailandica]